jgi:hypothetical protein
MPTINPLIHGPLRVVAVFGGQSTLLANSAIIPGFGGDVPESPGESEENG